MSKKKSQTYHYYDRRRIFFYLILILILAIVVGLVIFNTLNKPNQNDFMQTSDAVCSKADGERSFTYDVCFDEPTKHIILDIKRTNYNSLNFNSLKISYNDGENKSFDILQIPEIEELKTYDFESLKNPLNVDVFLNFNIYNSEISCDFTKRLSVDLCSRSTRPDFKDSNDEVNATTGSNETKKIPLTIAQKEDYWKNECSSVWSCEDYGECVDGIQRRDCIDLNKCDIPTDLPGFSRYCSVGNCVEDWRCEWGSCEEGVSIPNCIDQNSCGTEFHKPSKVFCGEENSICNPNIVCENWDSCELDYELSNVEGLNFSGVQSRICEDLNGCIGKVRQTKTCSLAVDIYTRRSNECENSYVEIYNSLTGSKIAEIDRGDGQNPYFNIYLGGRDSCGTCFNNIQDGEEEGIDCGGNCKACEGVFEPVSNKGFFSRVKSFFGL